MNSEEKELVTKGLMNLRELALKIAELLLYENIQEALELSKKLYDYLDNLALFEREEGKYLLDKMKEDPKAEALFKLFTTGKL